MIGGYSIKRGFSREVVARPLIFIPLPSLNPVPLWGLRDTLTHTLDCSILAGSIACIDMMAAIGRADKMNMRVDKAWYDGFAPKVEILTETVSISTDFVVR